MYLLIGPPGTGKTLFLKRLQSLSAKNQDSNELTPSTIPTVGTNLITVLLGRRDDLTIRELGGAMGPIWHNYYSETNAIIFMLDICNRFQVSAACIHLLTTLSHPDTQTSPVLILFNKIDMSTVMSRGEIESLLRLDDIIKHSVQKITVLEMSAKTNAGLDGVAKWIKQNYSPTVIANTSS